MTERAFDKAGRATLRPPKKPAPPLFGMGGAAAISALQRSVGNQSVQRLLTPRIQRRLEGWDQADNRTKTPEFHQAKGHSYQIVNEALADLPLGADETKQIAMEWGREAVTKGLVGAGPVEDTYKSSFDLAPGDFSVSQDVPMIPAFVVHAHVKGDRVAADGGVSLKFKALPTDTTKYKIPPSDVPDVINLPAAKQHWTGNPTRPTQEQAAQAKLAAKLLKEEQAALAKAAKAKAKEDAKAQKAAAAKAKAALAKAAKATKPPTT